jgi:hypothetical protein
MPLRLLCRPVQLTPGRLLHSYWGATGYYRPICDVYVMGPHLRTTRVFAQVDTACDYVVLESKATRVLGLALPFARQEGASGAAGTQATRFSFAPDGLVSLFVTDYREYGFLPRPPVGFHPPARAGTSQRSVLGLKGFLQFFKFVYDPEPACPFFELDPIASFPGRHGLLPSGRALFDFIRSLRVP